MVRLESKAWINPAVAHLIIEPVQGVMYSFMPNGEVFVGEKRHRHKYFNRRRFEHAREINHAQAIPSLARALNHSGVDGTSSLGEQIDAIVAVGLNVRFRQRQTSS